MYQIQKKLRYMKFILYSHEQTSLVAEGGGEGVFPRIRKRLKADFGRTSPPEQCLVVKGVKL